MKKLLALVLVLASLTLTAETIELPLVLGWSTLEKEIAISLHWQRPQTDEANILLGTEDAVYIAPTADDIQQLLWFYRWRREGLGYIDEAWDCDNFAREFKYWADVWSVRYYSRSPAAIAVGVAYVCISGDITDLFPRSRHRLQAPAYHCLNVILRADGQWLWFEPQTGQLVNVESMLYEGTISVFKIQL
jgi:hypothetical protein